MNKMGLAKLAMQTVLQLDVLKTTCHVICVLIKSAVCASLILGLVILVKLMLL